MIFSALIIASQVWAAPTEPKVAQKQNLQTIQSEVRRLETGIKSGKEAEASLASELGRLEKLLKLQALEIQLSGIELEKLEAHVQEMMLRRDSLTQSISSRKTRLRRMLSILPSLETRSPIARLTEEDGVYLSQYRELVTRILRVDREEIVSLNKILSEVEGLNAKLNEDKERMIAHTEDLREQQTILSLNQKLKIDLLKKNRTEQSTRLRAYQSAKAAESELESMLSKFNLAAEMKRQTEKDSPIANILPKKMVSFSSRKGELPLPLDGKIVSVFGKRYDSKTSLYTFHKGVEIQSPPSASVKAVFGGKVVYEGKIGGYGELLILDHGDQYYSLVGHLGEALKKEGDEVKEGDVIARTSADSTPLYFEIRQRHIAVNPAPWFSGKN